MNEALYFARKHLNSDRFLALSKRLASDHELLNLLPEGIPGNLTAELGQLLSEPFTSSHIRSR
jgi:hypothetical protein